MTTRDEITISVVIPCYNGGAFLREAINSALMQSHSSLEILVIDDGSTDDSAAIAGSFGPPVRVIRQENRGESVARNRGIDEARGSWIAFLDADDFWRPDKLQCQVRAIAEFPEEIICAYTDYFIFSGEGDRREVQVEELDRREDYHVAMILDWCIHTSSSLVLRSAALAVRFPENIRHGEDRIFFWRLREIGHFLRVPGYLTGYRSSASQQTKEIDYLLSSSRSYLDILAKFTFSDLERIQVRKKILDDLILGHRRAYYARDVRLARAYRTMYAKVASRVDHRPGEMSKRLYPVFFFRIKDKIDALKSNGHRGHGNYDQEFYDNVDARTVNSASQCVPTFLKLLAPRSVVDVGCGLGHWLKVFIDLGVDDVLGIEGPHLDPADIIIPRDRFIHRDLSRPFDLDRTFDLALCLEVAEHLPSTSAEGFVRSLAKLAPIVVFSAAIPGQGGVDHLNERWPWYWQELFARHNFIRFDPFRKQFWGSTQVANYYQQNLFLFVRSDVAPRVVHNLPNYDSQGLTLISERNLRKVVEGHVQR